MNKPRLLIVLNRLSVGGPATNILSTAAALSNSFEILLVAGEPLQDEQSAEYLLAQYHGFRVEKLATLKRAVIPLMDIRSYYRIKKIIREFKPHIVHTHGAKPGLVGRIAAWRLGVPVIVHTFHGHVFHSYFNPFISGAIVKMERLLSKITTAVVAINQQLQTELVHTYQIAQKEKIKLINLGLATEKFHDADGSKRKKFRSEFELSENEIAIGIAGRLVPVKQHQLFIEVAEKLIRTGKKNIRFFIVGDGHEKANLQKLLAEKNIQFSDSEATRSKKSLFIFTSWRSDMDCVFAGLDIVMLTSLNEGSPVSIMEAMAAAKPVVATNVGGVPELVQNGITGFCCNTTEELAAYLLRLVEDESLRVQLGSKAGEFAQKWFSKESETSQLEVLYRGF